MSMKCFEYMIHVSFILVRNLRGNNFYELHKNNLHRKQLHIVNTAVTANHIPFLFCLHRNYYNMFHIKFKKIVVSPNLNK